MTVRLSIFGLALFAQAAMFIAPAAFAQDTTLQPVPVDEVDPSLARRAIRWSQDRLVELDATIAVLEQDSARLQGDARVEAETALKELRDRREAYRVQAEEAAANAKTWTDAQVAEARKSLDESWTAFQSARDNYLDTAKADLATRRTVLEAEFEAHQKAWQKSIDELRAEADKLAAEQRAAVEAEIDALEAQAEETKARTRRLQDASIKAWNTAEKGYADAQQLFFDTYVSIRRSVEDATN